MTEITFNLFGTKNLAAAKNIENFLNALESIQPLSPQLSSTDERKFDVFNRKWFILEATNPKLESENYLYFKRKSSPKYNGYCKPGTKPYIGITFSSKLARKYHPDLMKWCHNIVAAFTPDYAVLSPSPKYINNPTSEIDDLRNLFRLSTYTVPGTYYKGGPPGVGICTWLGQHYISQMDQSYLEATPNIAVKSQDWGGYSMTLESDNPWLLDEELLKNKWLPAMRHLSELNIFSEQYLDENNVRRRRKSKNCNVGGII